jgi:hypothetical protein
MVDMNSGQIERFLIQNSGAQRRTALPGSRFHEIPLNCKGICPSLPVPTIGLSGRLGAWHHRPKPVQSAFLRCEWAILRGFRWLATDPM